MTVYLYPADAVSGAPSYTAETWRLLANGIIGGKTSTRPLGGRTGVWPGTPATTVSVAGSTITIAAHGGVLDLETPADAGPYTYAVDPAETRTLTAASATDQRVDSIFVKVDDPAEGDGSSTPAATVNYVTGTVGPAGGARGAAGGPPNVPARSLEIAQITVPKLTTGSPSVTWVAPSTIAAGGIIPAASASQYPFGAYVGQFIDDTSLGLLRWDGTAWQKFGLGGDTGWLTLPVGASFDASSTAQMRLKQGTVRMRKLVQLDSGSAFATSSDVTIINAGGLPSAFQPSSQVNQILSGPNVGQSVRVIVNSDGSMHFVTQASTGLYVDVSGCRYDVD